MYESLLRSKYDWEYYAERSNTASKLYPKGSYWPRGKMLGGSSSINTMIFLRGNPQDYDNWEALGNPTWGYTSVLEYFKKSEDNKALDRLDASYHNSGGPLKINFFYDVIDSKLPFETAAMELGYEIVDDFNAGKYIGFGTVQGNVNEGTRQSTAKAFLTPIKNRANLDVVKNALVTELIYNDKNDKVVGVHFVVKDKKCIAKTRKEVILSAGSINTPQILMLSGIGPVKQLKKHNIELKQNLPVGQNLQDHLIVPLFIKFKGQDSSLDSTKVMDAYYNYIRNKEGPLSTISSLDFVGFVNTKNDSSAYPDVEYHHLKYARDNLDIIELISTLGIHKRIIHQVSENIQESDIALVTVALLNPESKGAILLRSCDPQDKPKIYPNYLNDKADLDTVVKGIQLYENFLLTPSFQAMGAELVKFSIPECDAFPYRTTEYWESYTRHFSTTLYHPVGTAKMGPEIDKTSVVDSTLKVHGVDGLRVIDSSIMPKIVSANIHAAAIMIGEKGADFVKEQWTNDVTKSKVPVAIVRSL